MSLASIVAHHSAAPAVCKPFAATATPRDFHRTGLPRASRRFTLLAEREAHTQVIDWWQSLVMESRIFYAIGIVSLVSLLFQMLLTILGLGGEHDADIGVHGDHDAGSWLINVRTVMAFLSGFGWAGGILLNRGYALGPAIARSVVVGALFLLGTAVLVRNLLKLQSSGNLDYANAIGMVGTVYSTIPAAEAGGGQLEVLLQGRLITADARTQSSPDLKPGTQARVVALIGQSTLLVEPLSLP